jgi:hypothetical protein
VKSLALILRDHRDRLRERWIDELDGLVDPDYRELLASPLGERALRALIDGLVAVTQAEEYEVPGIRRRLEQQAAADAAHWVSLGFTPRDVVGGLHALRGASIDVLLDALVQDETPSFGDTLDQLKVLDAFLDRLVRASMTTG